MPEGHNTFGDNYYTQSSRTTRAFDIFLYGLPATMATKNKQSVIRPYITNVGYARVNFDAFYTGLAGFVHVDKT